MGRNKKGQFVKEHKINVGRICSEGTKRKLRKNSARYWKGKKRSEETKKKMRKARLKRKEQLGYINSPITRKKLSRVLKGKKLSKKHKEELSRAKRGENNWNWKGGISFEPYPLDWTDDLKEAIRKRDNHICQLCGIHQDELKEKLHCHHVDYDKDNLNPENLISLCRSCHIKTNYNRKYWINYFNK